jgi:hypothetical protein
MKYFSKQILILTLIVNLARYFEEDERFFRIGDFFTA